MNKSEYYNSKNTLNMYYKQIHKLLEEWKYKYNITERCIVHHRDDNEEVRAYNEAHYELWGYNLDGTFEYGKYVVFMTRAEHNTYHFSGNKNPMYGKPLSDEHKAKISAARKGIPHSAEAKAKISATLKGHQSSDETRAKISAAHKGRKLSNEWRAKLSIAGKGKHDLTHVKFLYTTYKNNGGNKKWNEFQKYLKTMGKSTKIESDTECKDREAKDNGKD